MSDAADLAQQIAELRSLLAEREAELVMARAELSIRPVSTAGRRAGRPGPTAL